MKLWLLVWAALAAVPLQAQNLRKIPFLVEGYEISKVGYPSRLVAGPENRFAYVEFWQQGRVRNATNHFLQGMLWTRITARDGSVGEGVEEAWALPATEAGKPRMDVRDVFATNGHYALLGRLPDGKNFKSVIQFADANGRPKGPQQGLTPFKESMKEYTELVALAPGGSKLVWLAFDHTQEPKKRTYQLVTFEADGRFVGREAFRLEASDKGYMLKDICVDKRGAVYLLQVHTALDGTAADSLRRPIVTRFDPRERKFSTLSLQWQAPAGIYLPHLHVTANDQLWVLAMAGGDAATSIRNGAALGAAPQFLAGVHLQRFALPQNAQSLGSTYAALPDSLPKRYARKSDGANFSGLQAYEDNGQVYWLLEEQFSKPKPTGTQYFYEDVLAVAFTPEGQMRWATALGKQQSDLRSDNLLGYTLGHSSTFLHMVYLTKMGAGGEILLRSINRETGGFVDKPLISNENGDYMFFPRRSLFHQAKRFILLGVGNPSRNGYYLITIDQLP